MTSRPRRSAAKKAHEAITDWADSERTPTMSTRSRRPDGASSGRTSGVTRDPPSSPGHESLNLTVKVPANKLREATSGRSRNAGAGSIHARESFVGGEIIAGKRNRGAKKSYVVESDSDEEEEEEDDDDEMADLGDDDDMEVDADGDEDEEDEEDADGDADGDVDMDATPAHPTTIKIQTPKANKVTVRRPAAARVVEEEDEEDDDDELSDLESDAEVDMSINVVGDVGDEDDDEEDEEEDAEGEEEDAEGEEEEEEEEEDAEGEADETMDVTLAAAEDMDSDDDGSESKEPDVNKMTRRQRARFEDEPQEYMKLSDEVQVKKHLTAEELSMRRSEMARRRRNLSEKRNEEVKMETINKLLKKQAPKTNRKAQENQAGDDKPDAMFVRWVSTKEGSRIAVPDEMLGGSAGKVFGAPGLRTGRMVEEVQ
ncbi:hypothetical protein HYQ45_003596 [Verticillium longisporum]|nr:hypothetical protein HYQ45_003596 [Verticillium longisporum]